MLTSQDVLHDLNAMNDDMGLTWRHSAARLSHKLGSTKETILTSASSQSTASIDMELQQLTDELVNGYYCVNSDTDYGWELTKGHLMTDTVANKVSQLAKRRISMTLKFSG